MRRQPSCLQRPYVAIGQERDREGNVQLPAQHQRPPMLRRTPSTTDLLRHRSWGPSLGLDIEPKGSRGWGCKAGRHSAPRRTHPARTIPPPHEGELLASFLLLVRRLGRSVPSEGCGGVRLGSPHRLSNQESSRRSRRCGRSWWLRRLALDRRVIGVASDKQKLPFRHLPDVARTAHREFHSASPSRP